MVEKRWTIDDALDPKSGFWFFSEDLLNEWIDSHPPPKQDEAVRNLERWIAQGDIIMEEHAGSLKEEFKKDLNILLNPNLFLSQLKTHMLKSLIESKHIEVTIANGKVALSALNLTKLDNIKRLMQSHGNKVIEYKYKINKKGKKVHTYIFIIDR